ncbi:MAG TPA: ABC transporter permease [Vicinamibacterales bacterium]|nr:ABC transporter permease [Vicinamibacterales bacterium]
MRNLAQDVRYGIRLLSAHPAYFVSAVLTLALGIAFNTATFSVINAVLLRPLPYNAPDDLLMLREQKLPQYPEFSVSPGNFLTWQEQVGPDFVGLAAFRYMSANVQIAAGDPQRLETDPVTPNLLDLLGVSPILGRGFLASDGQEGAPPVVLLSYAIWQSRFGGARDVVGRSIRINLVPATIIGVMPSGFVFPSPVVDKLWVPLTFTPAEGALYRSHYLSSIARVRPGVGLVQARADLNAVARRLAEAHPEDDRGWEVLATPLHDWYVSDIRSSLLILLGAVALVLLIACVNVANLLLARGAGRRKELAVRAALGATRGRIVRQLLVENLLLGATGALAGVLIARWLLRALLPLVPDDIPGERDIALQGAALLFAAGLTGVTTLLFGLFPALHAAKIDLRGALAPGGRQGGAAPARRTRFALATAEIALAMMLLVGAGLLIRSFAVLSRQSPGFVTGHAVMARLRAPAPKYRDAAARLQFFRSVIDRVSALSTVTAVGVTEAMPFVNDMVEPFVVEGSTAPSAEWPSANLFVVSPGYFKAMGVPILRGRELANSDRAGAPRVVVINETLAGRFFGAVSPIGRRLRVDQGPDGLREIVGVASDVKMYGLDDAPRPQIYESWQQNEDSDTFTLVTRTSGSDAAALVPQLRAVVRAVDPDVPFSDPRTLDALVGESIGSQRFSAVLIGVFAASATLLAAIGLYGVLAYMVGQRAREFGIRVACGASQRAILRLVLWNAAQVSGTGLALGLAGALILRRLIAGVLFGITPGDPLTYGLVALGLAAVVAIASIIPARRATRADPIIVLRID